jgi:hypothetical protein
MAKKHGYSGKFPNTDQVALEERIAAILHGKAEEVEEFTEEVCAELGREILYRMVAALRPDLLNKS